MNGPLRRLAGVITLLFASLLISATYVQFVDAPSLRDQPTNSRTLLQEYGRERGAILVGGRPIAQSEPVDDAYKFLRTYPGGPQYANITGYFSIVYGATGVESAAGDLLAGTADQLFYRRISDLLTGKQQAGASVELTINRRAQEAAWDALGDRQGAVVALDPKTGNVLAMVSKPSFDPDELASHDRGAVVRARTELLADDDDPLSNRASGEIQPPGSTFKIITSAAALSDGRWTPGSQLDAPKELQLPQTNVRLGNFGGATCSPSGRQSLADALRISCNTAFANLGLALGADALREQAEKFGWGQELRTPLRTAASQVPQEMDRPQTALSAIGQFEVRATPLQIAMVSAGIANDGVVMRPNLISRVQTQDLQTIDQQEPERLSEAVSPEVADQLTGMMEGVVERGSGTRAQIDGVRVAGKTGTAEWAEGEPPHAWFTGFAPADDPQIAVAVLIEEGGGVGDAASGGRLAAPVAKRVMEAVVGG